MPSKNEGLTHLKSTMESRQWATVREASEFYHVGRQRIHNLIKQGSLGVTETISLGSRKLLLIEYPFKWQPKPVGRPKIKKGTGEDDSESRENRNSCDDNIRGCG
jgi:hypothetical protein